MSQRGPGTAQPDRTGTMTRLIIPTRNRPVSAAQVLRYLAEFYPGSAVIVADGSQPEYHAAYDAAIVAAGGRLALEYRRYDPRLPLADRLIDVLEALADEYVVVGADDDFPLLDELLSAEPFLADHPDYVLAIGAVLSLAFEPDGSLRARLMHARSIISDSPVARLLDYARWPFPTSFALVRRTQLIARCRRLDLNAAPFFGDFTMGFHDLLAGKILALPQLGYIRTVNAAHSKLRSDASAPPMAGDTETEAIARHYALLLASEARLPADEADALAARLVAARIATKADPPHNRPFFAFDPLFREPVIRLQYRSFRQLLREGSPERRRHLSHLRFVVEGMREVEAQAIDNAGEPKVYESLSAMQ
ncbi:MAG: TIGR00180 family glycosyltransferase [Hyphomicrobiaceae bacterium]